MLLFIQFVAFDLTVTSISFRQSQVGVYGLRYSDQTMMAREHYEECKGVVSHTMISLCSKTSTTYKISGATFLAFPFQEINMKSFLKKTPNQKNFQYKIRNARNEQYQKEPTPPSINLREDPCQKKNQPTINTWTSRKN